MFGIGKEKDPLFLFFPWLEQTNVGLLDRVWPSQIFDENFSFEYLSFIIVRSQKIVYQYNKVLLSPVFTDKKTA